MATTKSFLEENNLIDEQSIEKLFPKCRPKRKQLNSDVKKNFKSPNSINLMDNFTDKTNMRSTSSGFNNGKKIGFKLDEMLLSPTMECASVDELFTGNHDECDDEDEDDNLAKETKLRESRIEIAGGREVFSASRSKPNKKRFSHGSNENKKNKKCNKIKRNNTTQTTYLYNVNSCDSKVDILMNDNYSSEQNECLEKLKNIQSNELSELTTENVVDSNVTCCENPNQAQVILDNMSEVDNEKLQLTIRPLKSEVECLTPNSEGSLNESNSQSVCSLNYKEDTNTMNNEEADSVKEANKCAQSKESPKQSPKESPKEEGIARVIGNVPIAYYEGSPRRYGPRPPGYPKRIIHDDNINLNNKSSEVNLKGNDISCDELVKSILNLPLPIEESPTNSITDSPKSTGQSATAAISNESNDYYKNCNYIAGDIPPHDINDINYKLYRMDVNGSDLVGKKFTNLSQVNSEQGSSLNVSPLKTANKDLLHENQLILLHERVHQHILNQISSVDCVPLNTDIHRDGNGPAINRTENFTLSPEMTDCDSNEIESEFSIEGSLNSNSKLMNNMPILEDGLSSGLPSSDNELDDDLSNESPINFDFVKKQINDIEKEILANFKSSINKNNYTSQMQQTSHSLSNGSSSSHTEQCFDYSKRNKAMPDRRNIGENETDFDNQKNSDINNEENDATIWDQRENESYDKNEKSSNNVVKTHQHDEDCDTDQETDRLLGMQRNDDRSYYENNANKKSNNSREVIFHEPSVLIEGVLFRARYLGSTQLVCEGQPTKATRMMQAEEAVSRIKAPEGETQPSTDVDLFISTEKIMVLNTDLKEIMMDHSLRTISYIADIGDLLVLMARRRVLNNIDDQTESSIKRIPKMICHVFESEEAQFIAQSIGQAFQVAYMEFLKANGIEDSSFVKEMDYQEVLNSQEIFGNELEMFAKKERQKEVIVPKQKGEILGMVIVESGWGSMLPTVVIANMAQQGPAARCGHLNIGDQIIAINGVSLVGLPLSTCQAYIKNTKNQTVVKFTVVPCPPVVEVKIKRPDTKYQLGFSVQNGVICSLLRGGIAERGGVRVGHRIIEINGQSVVAVPHDRIVNLLATSVGEIHMKTMPTSMFRLLTGQELPTYM